MSVLYIALPLALLLGAGGMIACIYCIRAGQYDDLETPSVRILIEDQEKISEVDDHSDSQPSRDA